MLRSLSVMLLLLLGCTRAPDPGAERAKRKPRVEVVVLTTAAESFADAKWLAKLSEAWKQEAQRCVLPDCAVVELSSGAHADAAGTLDSAMKGLGYSASVLSASGVGFDAGTPHLSANIRGAVEELFLEPVGVRLQVLGLSAGPLSDSVTSPETTLQRIAPEVFKRRAHGTIVVTDLCVAQLAEMVERNGRSWPFVLVALGRPCGAPVPARHIYATLVVAAGEGGSYSRSVLTFDRNTGALLKADSTSVAPSP